MRSELKGKNEKYLSGVSLDGLWKEGMGSDYENKETPPSAVRVSNDPKELAISKLVSRTQIRNMLKLANHQRNKSLSGAKYVTRDSTLVQPDRISHFF